jgi:gamma-glutamylcyclotransferase
MRDRCPSARLIGVADLPGWHAVYDKPAADGSAKLNIRLATGSSVSGVVYEIDEGDGARLDAAEPAYTRIQTNHGLAYAYRGEPTVAPPTEWYVAIVEAGARSHGLTPPEIEVR